MDLVYRNADGKLLESLEVIHNQGLRLSLGAFKSSPLESLNIEAYVHPLRFRRQRLGLQYGLKIKAHKDNAAFDCIFDHKYPDLYIDNRRKRPFAYDFNRDILGAGLSLDDILPMTVPDIPVWNSGSINVSFDLTEFDKKSTTPEIFRSRFKEMLP